MPYKLGAKIVEPHFSFNLLNLLNLLKPFNPRFLPSEFGRAYPSQMNLIFCTLRGWVQIGASFDEQGSPR